MTVKTKMSFPVPDDSHSIRAILDIDDGDDDHHHFNGVTGLFFIPQVIMGMENHAD